jgi:DNA-binding GntR family transcriptional regulator
MSNMSGKPTNGQRVLAALREDILSGLYEPGSPLPSAELCVRYSTSVGVLREALARLSEQGLVRSQPQVGFQVAPISPGELAELTEARVELEPMVLRHALARGDIEWESQLVASHHRMDAAMRAKVPPVESDTARSTQLADAWSEAHREFHAALLAGCANRPLIALAGSLRDSAELYRRWSGTLPPDSDRDVGAEHRELLEAALARDEDLAPQLLAAHIQRTTDILLDFLSRQHPDESVAVKGKER